MRKAGPCTSRPQVTRRALPSQSPSRRARTLERARPRPSSSMDRVSTPTMVLLPESTLPMMATRTCPPRQHAHGTRANVAFRRRRAPGVPQAGRAEKRGLSWGLGLGARAGSPTSMGVPTAPGCLRTSRSATWLSTAAAARAARDTKHERNQALPRPNAMWGRTFAQPLVWLRGAHVAPQAPALTRAAGRLHLRQALPHLRTHAHAPRRTPLHVAAPPANLPPHTPLALQRKAHEKEGLEGKKKPYARTRERA